MGDERPLLTEQERHALLERERRRMAQPGYRETLEDPGDLAPAGPTLTDEELAGVCAQCRGSKPDNDLPICPTCAPPISFCRVFQVGPICPGVCAGCLPAALAQGYNARAERIEVA